MLRDTHEAEREEEDESRATECNRPNERSDVIAAPPLTDRDPPAHLLWLIRNRKSRTMKRTREGVRNRTRQQRGIHSGEWLQSDLQIAVGVDEQVSRFQVSDRGETCTIAQEQMRSAFERRHITSSIIGVSQTSISRSNAPMDDGGRMNVLETAQNLIDEELTGGRETESKAVMRIVLTPRHKHRAW